jgi:lysophospholipase L1-like esterase
MAPAMPKPLATAATIVAATAIALLLGEVIARVALPPLPSVEVREDPGAVDRRRLENEEEQPGLYVHTPVGLRLRANKVAVVHDHYFSGLTFEVRTNSLGYRNPEIGAKTRPRILFLGDSITIAGYMPEAETYVRRVQALSEEDGGAPLETINAGVGGVSMADELAILTETGLSTDPDVVVLAFYLNDAIPSPAVVLLPPPRGLERSRLWAHLALAVARLRGEAEPAREKAIPDLDAWLAEVRRRYPPGKGDPRVDRGAFNAEISKNFRDWGTAWSEPAWERMEPVLRELHRLAGLHGFALRIVCFPHRLQVDAEFVADEPQRTMKAIATELDTPCLDLLPALRAAERRGVGPLFYDHCHPTAAGHEIVAREILRFLREHGA